MKKLLVIPIIAILMSFSSLNIGDSNNTVQSQDCNSNDSRQCCTRTTTFSGGQISVTACAGWIFSNNARAFNRACNKAYEALQGALNHQVN